MTYLGWMTSKSKRKVITLFRQGHGIWHHTYTYGGMTDAQRHSAAKTQEKHHCSLVSSITKELSVYISAPLQLDRAGSGWGDYLVRIIETMSVAANPSHRQCCALGGDGTA